MKITKRIPLFLASLLLTGGLTACGGGGNDQNVLNIVCINAGYDRVWIDKIAEKFTADHPEITVNIRADRNSESIIQQNLSKSKNTDDLYISVGAVWKSYAAQGYFADLSDLIEEEVDVVVTGKRNVIDFPSPQVLGESSTIKRCLKKMDGVFQLPLMN